MVMVSVTAMHEYMHQWACQQQQQREQTHHMGQMFGQ